MNVKYSREIFDYVQKRPNHRVHKRETYMDDPGGIRQEGRKKKKKNSVRLDNNQKEQLFLLLVINKADTILSEVPMLLPILLRGREFFKF